MDNATNMLVHPLRRHSNDSELGPSRILRTRVQRSIISGPNLFTERIRTILITLMFFAFYPSRKRAKFKCNAGLGVFFRNIFHNGNPIIVLLSVIAIVFNLGFFLFNVHGIREMAMSNSTLFYQGDLILNPIFVAEVINCQKPLISCFNLLTFLLGSKSHRNLLKELNLADILMFEIRSSGLNLKRINIIFVLACSATFVLHFGTIIAVTEI